MEKRRATRAYSLTLPRTRALTSVHRSGGLLPFTAAHPTPAYPSISLSLSLAYMPSLFLFIFLALAPASVRVRATLCTTQKRMAKQRRQSDSRLVRSFCAHTARRVNRDCARRMLGGRRRERKGRHGGASSPAMCLPVRCMAARRRTQQGRGSPR